MVLLPCFGSGVISLWRGAFANAQNNIEPKPEVYTPEVGHVARF